MFTQILNLAQLSIAIIKDGISLDFHDMVYLARLLPICLNMLREEKSSYIERDTFGHVSHDQTDIVCDGGIVALEGPLPVDTLDVPLARVQVVFDREVLVEHAQKWACCHHYEFIQEGQLVTSVLHALDQIDDEGFEQLNKRKDVIAVEILVLEELFE